MLPQISLYIRRNRSGMNPHGLVTTMIQQKDGFTMNTWAGFTQRVPPRTATGYGMRILVGFGPGKEFILICTVGMNQTGYT